MTNQHYQQLSVDLGDRSYPIYIGWGMLDNFAASFTQHTRSRRAMIITDETVRPLYGDQLAGHLNRAGIETTLTAVPAGEESKCLDTLKTLYDQMMAFRLERSDTVIALGGGVIGDLAGFAAATFKRGAGFVQVPTTLLAMVDSSVGGKTGINHPGGKNMIGAFYQPSMVFADAATLATLPQRELGCGLCETVKHAVIRDEPFFRLLQDRRQSILALEPAVICDLIFRNCSIKADVVSKDERESGLRRILNYGHTIGHPFETVLPGHPYHHGEAVALGIVAENRLAVQYGILSAADAAAIQALLHAFGLPVSVSQSLPIDALYQAMLQDKKVSKNRIIFAIPDRIGNCIDCDKFTDSDIKTAIASLTG